MPETIRPNRRVRHSTFGLGIVIENVVSESGKTHAHVIFDDGQERSILPEFLSDSKAPAPKAIEAKAKRKPAPEPEPVSDDLLVPDAWEPEFEVPEEDCKEDPKDDEAETSDEEEEEYAG